MARRARARRKSKPKYMSLGAQLLTNWRGEDREQIEIAERLGIAPETYNRFEHGYRRPNLKYASAIELLTGGNVPASSWYDPPRQQSGSEAKAS